MAGAAAPGYDFGIPAAVSWGRRPWEDTIFMEQYRRIQTGKKGDIHLVAFKDKKILDDTVLDEIRSELTQLIGKASALS